MQKFTVQSLKYRHGGKILTIIIIIIMITQRTIMNSDLIYLMIMNLGYYMGMRPEILKMPSKKCLVNETRMGRVMNDEFPIIDL